MALTKTEITEDISDILGLTKRECSTIVDGLFEIIKDELARGNPVKISGFGKWTVNAKEARTGRNPQTGKAMMIGPRKVVTFKPSHVLRDSLNSKD